MELREGQGLGAVEHAAGPLPAARVFLFWAFGLWAFGFSICFSMSDVGFSVWARPSCISLGSVLLVLIINFRRKKKT